MFENEQRFYIYPNIFLLQLLTNFDLNLITAYNYITFNKPFPSIIILGTISCPVMKILLFSSNYDSTQLTRGNGPEVTRANPLHCEIQRNS